MAARYAVPVAAEFGADCGSTSTDGGSAGIRFRRAIYRVLIALSFKSFRHRNETKRRRERSDCSEARFLPAAHTPVEDDTLAPEDDIQYVTAVRQTIVRVRSGATLLLILVGTLSKPAQYFTLCGTLHSFVIKLHRDPVRVTYGPRLSGIVFRRHIVAGPQMYAEKSVHVRRHMATYRNRAFT